MVAFSPARAVAERLQLERALASLTAGDVLVDANRDRDTRVQNALKELGWRVLVLCECETKRPDWLMGWLKRKFRSSKKK